MRQFSLEELVDVMQEMSTVSPNQFAAKQAVIETLNRLKKVRNRISTATNITSEEFSTALAVDLATALGVPCNRQRS